jgi:hypothetical protein
MESNRARSFQTRSCFLMLMLLLFAARAEVASAQAAPPAAAAAARDSAAVPPPAAAAPRVAAGCADGERDADAEHNARSYAIAGFLTGPIGVVFAARSDPKPHGPRVATLAQESAAEYGRCYGRRARKHNLKSAISGFAVATFTAITVNYFIESKTEP